MGYASWLGFGSVLWGKGRIISESGEFTPLYQERSSDGLEGDNLTSRKEQSVARGELKDVLCVTDTTT